jgi:hypothetical protein
VPSAAELGERHRDRNCDDEYELEERARADEPATGDETSDAQTFEEAPLIKGLDDGHCSGDCIPAEKQQGGRMYYLIQGTVTVKISLYESYCKV